MLTIHSHFIETRLALKENHVIDTQLIVRLFIATFIGILDATTNLGYLHIM